MLKNLPYLNPDEINFYYDQLNLEELEQVQTKKTFEISFAGPKFSKTFETDKKNISVYKKLDSIIEGLSYHNQIATSRPISDINWDSPGFVFENVKATKVFFPKSVIGEIYGLNHLVVWVANPDYSTLSTERWQFTGTFLYLIETAYDKGAYQTTLSGCSALQAVSNIVKGENILKKNWDEPLGRNNNKHPLQKLESIGGIVIGDRQIETIYRKRYSTDEQCFTYEGVEYRCNDLLGYPLFIDAKY
ncbi:hypothetical protein [Foetidibacter luteolus]|uniref:hypothetical protein n=1 Tax=Foetidibacter luteolus TaxID=2608880 RepID=UPI00129AF934|nr:hypothetical protein [Foetidibacter luteolus]